MGALGWKGMNGANVCLNGMGGVSRGELPAVDAAQGEGERAPARRPAQERISLRNCFGVLPVALRNTWEKDDWLLKPHLKATSLTRQSGCERSSLARLMRTSLMYWPRVRPVVFLNIRDRWRPLTSHNWARLSMFSSLPPLLTTVSSISRRWRAESWPVVLSLASLIPRKWRLSSTISAWIMASTSSSCP